MFEAIDNSLKGINVDYANGILEGIFEVFIEGPTNKSPNISNYKHHNTALVHKGQSPSFQKDGEDVHLMYRKLWNS